MEGKVLPSVTQVIGEWVDLKVYNTLYKLNVFKPKVRIPKKTMEKAAELGSAIHLGASFIAQGQGVDWDALDPSLVKPLNQFVQWTKDFQVEFIESELVLYSPEFGFAGTVDILCRILGKQLYVVDIKTGQPSFTVGPQTAAYLQMAREHGLFLPEENVLRASLKIPRDGGKYKFKALNAPENENDWAFFKARLDTLKYLKAVA